MNLSHQETLFIDDNIKNIDTVREMEFPIIHLTDPNELIPELRKIGISIDVKICNLQGIFMIEAIEIYDIDGTLTRAHGDIPDTTGFHTYAFWPLISQHFTKDPVDLDKMIADWDESMKTENDPTASSHEMMQRSIDTFREGVTGEGMRAYAKKLTLYLIHHGVIRKEAIAFLEARVKQGITCILSTGSYQDGALGFVDALVQAKLISPETQKKLRVSGAVVDWDDRTLLHANVRDRKLIGIEIVMGKQMQELRPHVLAVYGDDPWVNDAGILAAAPKGNGYVIATAKNTGKSLPDGYRLSTWPSIIQKQASIKTKADELEIESAAQMRAKL